MTRRIPALTLWRAWLLAALLLAAQAAGLAHRVSHAVGHAMGQGAVATASGWSHEQGSADCKLVDQLVHADALCGASAAALPARLLGVPNIVDAAQPAPAATTAVYLARGPPRG